MFNITYQITYTKQTDTKDKPDMRQQQQQTRASAIARGSNG